MSADDVVTNGGEEHGARQGAGEPGGSCVSRAAWIVLERPGRARDLSVRPDDVEVALVGASETLERECAGRGVDEDLRYLWVCGELGRSSLQQRDMVLELLRSRLCREASIALGSAAGVAAGCVVDVEGAGDRAAYDEGEKECEVDPERPGRC